MEKSIVLFLAFHKGETMSELFELENITGEVVVTLQEGEWIGDDELLGDLTPSGILVSSEGYGDNVLLVSLYEETIVLYSKLKDAPEGLEIGADQSISVLKNEDLGENETGLYAHTYTFDTNIEVANGTTVTLTFYGEYEENELPPEEDDNEEEPPVVDDTKIDRDQLIEDASLWLPQGNALTPEEMFRIAELVISAVGDDVKNYPEILCKFLGAVANVNVGKASVDSAGISKEKLGDHEITYGGVVDYAKVWSEFKDNLDNICPLFGYKVAKSKSAAKINAGERYNPLYC